MKNNVKEYYKVIRDLGEEGFTREVIKWSREANPAEIRKWKAIATVYLRDMGWNKRAIKDFFEIGTSNTFRLIIEDRNIIIKEFYDDVFYCSDRMSVERLCRCQVRYSVAVDDIENCEQRP